ncbi:MAG: DUF3617 domain-containing protein [Burkholderiaceae bacterium]
MRKTIWLLLSMTMATSLAVAQEKLKPGLWEMTMKSDAMKNMPKMSPEQMEQMRKMGVHVPQMQDGGMVTKVCITKEMAERDQMPMAQKESDCEVKNYQRSGDSYSTDVVCNGPNIKGTGKVKGKMIGNESFSSTYDFKGTAHGQPISQKHENSGKWLSSNCGNVKPLAEAPGKK